MENKNTHREPTLFIVGNKERADEICHIIKNEWGGSNLKGFEFYDCELAYFINSCGVINCERLEDIIDPIKNGWMKEYKLPEKLQFKPFDKVVVKGNGNTWKPALFGYIEDNDCWIQGYGWVDVNNSNILPYNEQTAKLIGTKDEWKGGEE